MDAPRLTRIDAAIMLHKYMLEVAGIPDLGDISGAAVLKDLYDCRKCVNHIAQVYLRGLMKQAHESGDPLMRPVFYRYPDDPHAWEELDEYLLGDDLLVAPVVRGGIVERDVYLPQGDFWQEASTGKEYKGGSIVKARAELDTIPLFIRAGGKLNIDLFR